MICHHWFSRTYIATTAAAAATAVVSHDRVTRIDPLDSFIMIAGVGGQEVLGVSSKDILEAC